MDCQVCPTTTLLSWRHGTFEFAKDAMCQGDIATVNPVMWIAKICQLNAFQHILIHSNWLQKTRELCYLVMPGFPWTPQQARTPFARNLSRRLTWLCRMLRLWSHSTLNHISIYVHNYITIYIHCMVYFTFFLSMCSVLATFCHRPSRYGALLREFRRSSCCSRAPFCKQRR